MNTAAASTGEVADMSITFEYSFNSELDMPALVQAVNRVLGTSFTRADGEAFSCELLGMFFVLEPNDAEDDCGIRFSDYRYQLWNKTWDGSSLREIQLEVLVMAAFALHELLGISEAILSYEVQRLLACYSMESGTWRDTISGMPVHPLNEMVRVQNRLDTDNS